MDQYLDTAYLVTTQLFGPESGIPLWAWALVLLAFFWKVLIPESKTAGQSNDRDAMMLSELFGEDGKSKSKKKK
jgi:hypothetical protein